MNSNTDSPNSNHIAVNTFAVWLALCASAADACPFCALLGSTMTIDVNNAEAAFLGGAPEYESIIVESIIKGEALVAENQTIKLKGAEKGTSYLVTGSRGEDGTFHWKKIGPMSHRQTNYLLQAVAAMEKPMTESAPFFLGYLGDRDQLIADDAYYQFAKLDYQELKELRSSLDRDRDRLIRMIESNKLMPEHGTLAYTLLGVCGTESDASIPLAILARENSKQLRGLRAIIASYLTLGGDKALKYVTDKYLKNPNATYDEVSQCVEAIQFHLDEGSKLEKKDLLASLHHVLSRPEYCELVLPELVKWEDWTAIEKVVELARNAPQEKGWIRDRANEYLAASPDSSDKERALEELDELKELDVTNRNASLEQPAPNGVTSTFWRSLANLLSLPPALLASVGAVTLGLVVLFVIKRTK